MILVLPMILLTYSSPGWRDEYYSDVGKVWKQWLAVLFRKARLWQEELLGLDEFVLQVDESSLMSLA